MSFESQHSENDSQNQGIESELSAEVESGADAEVSIDAEALNATGDSVDNASEEVVSDQESTVLLTGYELVVDMMRRQDEVIVELDALNHRIESAIKEISEARKLEEQSEEGAEAGQGVADEPTEQVRRAA